MNEISGSVYNFTRTIYDVLEIGTIFVLLL